MKRATWVVVGGLFGAACGGRADGTAGPGQQQRTGGSDPTASDAGVEVSAAEASQAKPSPAESAPNRNEGADDDPSPGRGADASAPHGGEPPEDPIDEAPGVDASAPIGEGPNPDAPAEPEAEPEDSPVLSDHIGLCSGLPADTPVVAGLTSTAISIGNAAGEFETEALPFDPVPADLRFVSGAPNGTAVLVAGEQDYPTHFMLVDAVTGTEFSIELTEENREDHGASFRAGLPSYVIGGASTATLVRGDHTWTQVGMEPKIVGVAELEDGGWVPMRTTSQAAFYHFEDKTTKALSFHTGDNVWFEDGRFYYITLEAADVVVLVSEGPEDYLTFETDIPVAAAENASSEVRDGFVLVRQDGFPRLGLSLDTGVAQINVFPPEQGLGNLSISPPWIVSLTDGKPSGVHDMLEGVFRTVDVGVGDAATRVYGAGEWFMGRDDIKPLWLFNARTGDFEAIDASEPLETKITWESCTTPLSPFSIQTFPQANGSILTAFRDEYEAGAYLRHPGDDTWHLLGRTVTGVFNLGASPVGGGAWLISGAPYERREGDGMLSCTGLGGGEYLSSDSVDALDARDHQIVSPDGDVFVVPDGQYAWVHPSGRCLYLYDHEGLSQGVDLKTQERYPFDFDFVNWL